MWIQVQLYTTLHTQRAHVTYFIKIYDELKDHFVFLFFYLWSKKKNVLKTEKNLFGQGFVCTLVLDYSSFKFASSQFSYFKPHPPSRWSFSNFKSYIIHETFFVCVWITTCIKKFSFLLQEDGSLCGSCGEAGRKWKKQNKTERNNVGLRLLLQQISQNKTICKFCF